MSEQNKGFTIKDRRCFTEEGMSSLESELTEEVVPEPQVQTNNQEDDNSQPCDIGKKLPRYLLPVDFSSFILSLSHTAMVHLGNIPDPHTGQNNCDLDLARHTIDTIGMLKSKTTGNLTQDEGNLIESILTELRLAFVRVST